MGDQEMVDEILHHLRLKKGGDADGGLLDAGLKPIFILSVGAAFVLDALSYNGITTNPVKHHLSLPQPRGLYPYSFLGLLQY